MATALYLNQYFTTTLNVGGGITNAQTTGIIIAGVSGLDITKPGIALVNYASPLNTAVCEWIEYSSINGSNELQGVIRGSEGFSAKAHSNGVSVAFPLSESHVNRLANAVSITGAATNIITGVLDEDTFSSNSDVKVPTQQSTKAYVDTAVASGASSNGWNTESATVTRTGSYTFTLVGDQTAKYTKGTKFRYKDGGSFEYGYVEVSSFASVTTVTLVANSDYTMAAVSITEPAFSYAQNPQGFPDFFSFTTTFTGFSANPSTSIFYFKLDAFLFSFYYVDGSDGTSNSTGLTFTIPVNAKRSLNQAGIITAKDNGTISSTPGHLTTTANSKTVNAYKVFSQGVWTSSAAKNIFMPVISFEWT